MRDSWVLVPLVSISLDGHGDSNAGFGNGGGYGGGYGHGDGRGAKDGDGASVGYGGDGGYGYLHFQWILPRRPR
jgi:hypothetical protein